MQEASQSLTLESKGELGECRRECNTIAHACSAPVTLVMQPTFPEIPRDGREDLVSSSHKIKL